MSLAQKPNHKHLNRVEETESCLPLSCISRRFGNRRNEAIATCVRAYASPKKVLFYMTVQGMQQQLQSSVLMQLHLPPWGLTMEPAAEEMEDVVEAGIVMKDGWRCDLIQRMR